MKKKAFIITFIFALLLTMLSTTAVLAEGDDHGADAHSDSMTVLEEDDYPEEELSFKDMIIDTVMSNIKYVAAAVIGLIVLIVVIKIIGHIRETRQPRYKGKH